MELVGKIGSGGEAEVENKQLNGQAIQLYVREVSTTQWRFTPKKWELVRIGLQPNSQSR